MVSPPGWRSSTRRRRPSLKALADAVDIEIVVKDTRRSTVSGGTGSARPTRRRLLRPDDQAEDRRRRFKTRASLSERRKKKKTPGRRRGGAHFWRLGGVFLLEDSSPARPGADDGLCLPRIPSDGLAVRAGQWTKREVLSRGALMRSSSGRPSGWRSQEVCTAAARSRAPPPVRPAARSTDDPRGARSRGSGVTAARADSEPA